MIKTKEQIFHTVYSGMVNNYQIVYNSSVIKATTESMGIYAKQEAIEFATWCGVQFFIRTLGTIDRWHSLVNTDKTYTTEQLYELYLQSKQQ